ETEITCELMLADQNWSESVHYEPRVFDENGEQITAQIVKEESNLNLDWRKRIVFRAPLKPLTVTRFSIYMELLDNEEKQARIVDGDIVIDLPEIEKSVRIDGKTGLLASYCLRGREYIGEGGAFCPMFWEDNPDPWGMGGFQLAGMGRNPVPFKLMEVPDGPFKDMKPIQIIEDGPVFTAVECFFACENTKVRVEYVIYKQNDAVDVTVNAFMNDANRMLKIRIPTANPGTYIGQTAFGTEELYMDGRECVAQRFTAMREEDGTCLTVFNSGTYGSSCMDGAMELSLIRGASYCAHPIGSRPLIPTDRFVKKIDMGERTMKFRLTAASEESLERLAAEFNMPPYACNVFPLTEEGKGKTFGDSLLDIADREITLVTMKKADGSADYILRLFNGCAEEKETEITLCGASAKLHFGKYEVKTLLYDGTKLEELDHIII
ncbi:MAG: hypothetical protein IJC71_02915, partial [Clostridia bacterium]|nr:hypothetical protein [Clostridia bacterium]